MMDTVYIETSVISHATARTSSDSAEMPLAGSQCLSMGENFNTSGVWVAEASCRWERR